MAYPKAKILWVSEAGIEEVAFEETEHLRIYEMFLKNHQVFIHHIIGEMEK